MCWGFSWPFPFGCATDPAAVLARKEQKTSTRGEVAMVRVTLALSLAAGLATAASAAEFVPVSDKSEFLDVLAGRELHIGLYSLALNVTPDGRIAGSALGWDITGTWSWQDGYFCREMDWSGTAIPFDCQLVELRGDTEMRFTVARGEGRSAKFRLR
jgi:hypothetical protein